MLHECTIHTLSVFLIEFTVLSVDRILLGAPNALRVRLGFRVGLRIFVVVARLAVAFVATGLQCLVGLFLGRCEGRVSGQREVTGLFLLRLLELANVRVRLFLRIVRLAGAGNLGGLAVRVTPIEGVVHLVAVNWRMGEARMRWPGMILVVHGHRVAWREVAVVRVHVHVFM